MRNPGDIPETILERIHQKLLEVFTIEILGGTPGEMTPMDILEECQKKLFTL